MNTGARQPMWAKCRPCGHHWIVLYVPMTLTNVATLLKTAHCPMCASASKQHSVFEPGRTPTSVNDQKMKDFLQGAP